MAQCIPLYEKHKIYFIVVVDSALKLFTCSLLFISYYFGSAVKVLNSNQSKIEWNAPALSSGFSIKSFSNSGRLLGNTTLPVLYPRQMGVNFCQVFDSKMLKDNSPLSRQQWCSLLL